MENFANDITGKYVFELISLTLTAKLKKINITVSNIIIPSNITAAIAYGLNKDIKIVELYSPSYNFPVFSSNVRSVTIPSSITSFGSVVFSRLTNLQKIIFNEPCNITEIQNSAFSNSGLTEITIPNSITSIYNYAFTNTQLKTITIPSTVKKMGISLFNDNSKIESVYFLGEAPKNIENPTLFQTEIFNNQRKTIDIYYYEMYKESFTNLKTSSTSNNTFKIMANPTTTTVNINLMPLVLPTTTTQLLKFTVKDSKSGIKQISDTEITMDITKLLSVNNNIDSAINVIINNIYPEKKSSFRLNKVGSKLYVYIDNKLELFGLNKLELFDGPGDITEVIFVFNKRDDSAMSKLLNIDTSSLKKEKNVNYINYIFLFLIILLICYIVYRLYKLNR